jgi:hypothetical protein
VKFITKGLIETVRKINYNLTILSHFVKLVHNPQDDQNLEIKKERLLKLSMRVRNDPNSTIKGKHSVLLSDKRD